LKLPTTTRKQKKKEEEEEEEKAMARNQKQTCMAAQLRIVGHRWA
jgi:hypothetical protein